MLTKALNDPKKWGWLIDDEKQPGETLTLQETMNIMNRSHQKHAYRSSLFKFDDLYMYQPKAAQIMLPHKKKQKKKRKKKK